jgi:hypothetical protein
MDQSTLFPIPIPWQNQEPEARHTDPVTSKMRAPTKRGDVQKVIDYARSIQPEAFTDDDVAALLGQQRNVAAKIRQEAEKLGWIIRTGEKLKNPRKARVMSFRWLVYGDS